MSTRELINEENNEEYIEEGSEGVSGRCYHLMKAEYERCRQEIHDLKRKLELNEAMLREDQEANELLERSLNRRIAEKEKIIFETEEKHRVTTKEYENIISNLETELVNQTIEIEELRQHVNRYEEIENKTTIDQFTDVSLKVDNAALKNRIDELAMHLSEEKKRSECAEETINELKAQYDEFERIYQIIKEQLAEKNRALEDARAELVLCRAETETLKVDPTHDLCKGNSLFAEVEDRRQNVVGKMNMLREKYTEVKRICKAQIAEIKMLRAERVATLRKWENNSDHTLVENDELIQKYKNRISDLESKLKSEIKKNDDAKQLDCNDASFGYFQSLLHAKRKEADELRIKIEDLSTQLLVQEEAKMNITKQLQYWRYKVSSLEAQVCTLQAELKLNLVDDGECKILLKEFEDLAHARSNDVTVGETEFILKQPKNFNQAPLLNSSEIGNTCSFKDKAECQGIDQLQHEERINHNDTARFKNISQMESREFKHAKSTNKDDGKCFKKVVCFNENTDNEKTDDSQKPTESHKYPVIYIPTDSKLHTNRL